MELLQYLLLISLNANPETVADEMETESRVREGVSRILAEAGSNGGDRSAAETGRAGAPFGPFLSPGNAVHLYQKPFHPSIGCNTQELRLRFFNQT